MEIDYNNLQAHFDIAQKKGKTFLMDKNRIADGSPFKKEDTIIEITTNEPFCDWWRHTENRETVKNWFKEKYPTE